MDVLCAFHDSDDGYGLLRWPLREIANTVGASMSHIKELVDKGVLRGSDTELSEAFVYIPRSGRKFGEPVTLIDKQPGPIWYSKRMVKDEYVRTIRGESTRFGESASETPKPITKGAPKPPLSDGSSSSSSSSSSNKERSLLFDRFWSAYPKKVGKGRAVKVFAKVNPDAALVEAMVVAVDRHKQSEQWCKDSGQFVPHPATWLNDERWLDESEVQGSNLFEGVH